MFDDNLIERFELASERIKEIKTAGGACSDGRFSDYFCKMSEFIISMTELFGKVKNNEFEDYTFNQLSEFNKSLYEDILEKNYDKSYANPVYAVKVMGLEYGRMLSFLYVELRGMIAYAYELRIAEMTVLMELFVEIYCSFESETPDSTSLRDIIYWYVSDYSGDFVEYRVREQIDTSLSFATDIIMNENLDDIRYLYKFGEYITDNEIMTATYLNSLPDEKISAMAHTFTEGYRKGFDHFEHLLPAGGSGGCPDHRDHLLGHDRHYVYRHRSAKKKRSGGKKALGKIRQALGGCGGVPVCAGGRNGEHRLSGQGGRKGTAFDRGCAGISDAGRFCVPSGHEPEQKGAAFRHDGLHPQGNRAGCHWRHSAGTGLCLRRYGAYRGGAGHRADGSPWCLCHGSEL